VFKLGHIKVLHLDNPIHNFSLSLMFYPKQVSFSYSIFAGKATLLLQDTYITYKHYLILVKLAGDKHSSFFTLVLEKKGFIKLTVGDNVIKLFCPFVGKARSLPASIRLGRKSLTGTNTLAYYEN